LFVCFNETENINVDMKSMTCFGLVVVWHENWILEMACGFCS